MNKPMALSYSRLSTFEQCPAKFDYLYVTKRVKDEDNIHTVFGSRVHEKLENAGKHGGVGVVLGDMHLDPEIAPFLPLVQRILDQPGEKLFEHQMALTVAREPCDWFAPEVWLRGIADVLIINGKTAAALDWKTGKVKNNPTQLMLFAAMVMSNMPQIDVVKTAFVWLQHNDITPATYTRAQLPTMWGQLLPRFHAVQESVDLGVFKTKPSGLCPWCPAKGICPDARSRR